MPPWPLLVRPRPGGCVCDLLCPRPAPNRSNLPSPHAQAESAAALCCLSAWPACAPSRWPRWSPATGAWAGAAAGASRVGGFHTGTLLGPLPAVGDPHGVKIIIGSTYSFHRAWHTWLGTRVPAQVHAYHLASDMLPPRTRSTCSTCSALHLVRCLVGLRRQALASSTTKLH